MVQAASPTQNLLKGNQRKPNYRGVPRCRLYYPTAYSALRSLLRRIEAADKPAPAKLVDALAQIPTATDEAGEPRLRLIAFDQFEEIFSAFPERWPDRAEFFAEVAAALERETTLRVLFLLREDYFADFTEFAHALSEGARTRYRLEPLRKAEALEAVRRPLEGTRWRFAPGVDEMLVRDLSVIRTPILARPSWEQEAQEGIYGVPRPSL